MKQFISIKAFFAQREKILLVLAAFLVAILILLPRFTTEVRGSVLQKSPTANNPADGIFVSTGYQARPNERGSIFIESAETLQGFEGIVLTVSVDPGRATINAVRKTAITQNFEIATSFPSPGVVHIALVGAPRQVLAAKSLLELDLQFASSPINSFGNEISVRLLGVSYLIEETHVSNRVHDGRITIVSNNDVPSSPLPIQIHDVEPSVVTLVRGGKLTIRGQAFPSTPTVFLGGTMLNIHSSSESQIIAQVPSTINPGVYTLSVESILADEQIVVLAAGGSLSRVDIIEDLLFFTPNPVLYSAQRRDSIALWLPIYNPLGPEDAIHGSVDLSTIGGDPNVTFEGVGSPVLGPGGAIINWFRIPENGTFQLPNTLETNADYPVTIRVENRSGTLDEVTEILSLRSSFPQGGEPSIAHMETVPNVVRPGDSVTLYTDISHPDGINKITLANIRLTTIGLGIQELRPAFNAPSGGVALTTMTYSTTFIVPESVKADEVYDLEFFLSDEDGNTLEDVYSMMVYTQGGEVSGDAPVFVGRREVRPSASRAGQRIDFFIELSDSQGTNTIDLVTADLIDIGGGILKLTPALTNDNIGILPVVFQGSYTLPNTIAAGNYTIPLRAIDADGLSSSETVVVTVTMEGSETSIPPAIVGRKLVIPNPAAPGTEVKFILDVKDENGTRTISSVLLDLVDIGGNILPLNKLIHPIANSTNPVPYSGVYTLPSSLEEGDYVIPIRVIDEDSLETSGAIQLTVSKQGSGASPVFSGRLESRPSVAAPGGLIKLYAELFDPEGTNTIAFVSAEFIDIGGSIKEMYRQTNPIAGSVNPVVYSVSFEIPSGMDVGSYSIPIHAVDEDGHLTVEHIPLTISSTGEGDGPIFSGRLEADPDPIGIGGEFNVYAEIRHPDGTNNIAQVTIDYIDIGGTIETMAVAVGAVSGSTEPVVYTSSSMLAGDVAPGIYHLPIRAVDKEGKATMAEVTLNVSAISQEGATPTILQFFATPEGAPANGTTRINFTAEIEDTDSVHDIQVVRINLHEFNLGYIYLKEDKNSISENGKRGLFVSDPFRIPTSVNVGTYVLTLEVEDSTGNRIKKTLSFVVGDVSLGGDAPRIVESRFIPEIARPGESVKLYVEIEDRNGTDTITVIADFTEVEQAAEELDELIDFPNGTLVTRNTFESDDIRIPKDLQQGVYDIPITIVDDTNNIVRRSTRLRVQRGGEDEGQEPYIDVAQIFQTPRVIPNNGKSGGELHVLVRDADDDVLTVIANFRGIGTAKSASVRENAPDFELMCGASRALACMKRSLPEDATARWFVLEDIRIPPTTLPSADPYIIELTAIDAHGHTEKVEVPLFIGDADVGANLKIAPEFLLLVPVDNDELELVLAPGVSADSIDRNGGQFAIQDTLHALKSLNVKRVSWDSSASILYLQTDKMKNDYRYIFHVKSPADQGGKKLTDLYGNPFVKDRGGSITFTAFGGKGNKPAIERVRLFEAGLMDVVFTTPILPSSVHPDLLQGNVTIRSLSSGQTHDVSSGVLHDDGRSLRLQTEQLLEGDRYEIVIKGVRAQGNIAAPPEGVKYIFSASFSQDVSCGRVILPTPDLNEDGRVNFDDFSLFSSVYNSEYEERDVARFLGCEENDDEEAKEKDDNDGGSSFGGNLPTLFE